MVNNQLIHSDQDVYVWSGTVILATYLGVIDDIF